jgi:hypothetical protein
MGCDDDSGGFIKVSGGKGSQYWVAIPQEVLRRLDPDMIKTLQELDRSALEGLDEPSVQQLADIYTKLAKGVSEAAAEQK